MPNSQKSQTSCNNSFTWCISADNGGIERFYRSESVYALSRLRSWWGFGMCKNVSSATNRLYRSSYLSQSTIYKRKSDDHTQREYSHWDRCSVSCSSTRQKQNEWACISKAHYRLSGRRNRFGAWDFWGECEEVVWDIKNNWKEN